MNPSVDAFLEKTDKWKAELSALRNMMLDCQLIETLKWGQPCYMFNKSNVIILGNFKESCIVSFIKGSLLSDTEKLLQKAGENTQGGRVLRFHSLQEIIENESIIKAYVFEAIEVEKAGLKIAPRDTSTEQVISELLQRFEENPNLKKAFESLTLGRQRAYNMFFEAAKQSTTRLNRIDSYTERILNKKGINDCVCGLSKRMPGCDGSHKQLAK
ncbi:MAG: hypothetical protein EBQ94_03000 [Flavobacteriales bacterium]|nr:hypothetical protein [Crocinitomicaceae bacterium]NBX79339.1 hypothetical protein [Flavobacteriales bacterium]